MYTYYVCSMERGNKIEYEKFLVWTRHSSQSYWSKIILYSATKTDRTEILARSPGLVTSAPASNSGRPDLNVNQKADASRQALD
jgi:hypothetical protein